MSIKSVYENKKSLFIFGLLKWGGEISLLGFCEGAVLCCRSVPWLSRSLGLVDAIIHFKAKKK